ncbi:MAG: CHAT domain-containing protein [Pseudomonadota bacterium]
MDRRDFVRLSSAVSVGAIAGPFWANSATASSGTQRGRRAVRRIYDDVLKHYSAGRHDRALAESIRLEKHASIDPNWHRYPESFSISMIRFELTPRQSERDRLMAAQGLVISYESLNGDIQKAFRAVAQACYELLEYDGKHQLFRESTERSSVATILLVISAAAPGPERTEWARSAANTLRRANANLVEEWGGANSDGMGLRASAVGTGLAGNWREAARFFERIFSHPEAEEAARIRNIGSSSGFAALHSGRESLRAEAATAYCLAGQLDRSMQLFEQSREKTPFFMGSLGKQRASALSLEEELTEDGAKLLTVSVTLAGALVILSQKKKGRLARTVAFDPAPGGVTLQALTVNSNTEAERPNGVIRLYRSARMDVSDMTERLSKYASVSTMVAEHLIGGVIGKSLKDSGVESNDELLIILPPSLAFLPVSLVSSSIDNQPLSVRYRLRFADSLSSAVNAKRTALQRASEPAKLSVMALGPDAGGPRQANFEKAAILGISMRANIASGGADYSRGNLVWPSEESYWHVGSHAVWNIENTKRSGIVIGPRSVTTIDDILAMRPDSPPRLVFLSACETALLNTTESLSSFRSLPTAFLAIGVGGVIASHWPVSDTASSLLSIKFYDEHLIERRTPSDALRAAQRWLRGASSSQLLEYLTLLAAQDEGTLSAVGGLADYLGAIDGTEYPFADRYYWGGFSLYGT